MNSRFEKGHTRSFEKVCENCGDSYISNSGFRKWCDVCRDKMSVCPECGGKKDVYDKFCGRVCAGKASFRNSEKVKEALVIGQQDENRKRIVGERMKATKGIAKPHLRKQIEGLSKREQRHREIGRVEYKEWRKAVYERDDYTCQICGKRGDGIYLNADHIKPLYTNPELIYDVNNGRTLCVECHKQTDTWGHKVKTRYICEKIN